MKIVRNTLVIGLLGYLLEILRDDGEQNTTKGTSFLDSNRTPEAVNTYTVTSIVSQGVRSEALSVLVGPYGSDMPEIIH